MYSLRRGGIKVLEMLGSRDPSIIARGYKTLKRKDDLGLLLRLKDTLARTKLTNISLPNFFLNQSNIDIELSLRQYLTERILGLSFNRSILYSIGANKALKHPLPKVWQEALLDKGVNLDKFSCTFLWHLYGIAFWIKGLTYSVKFISIKKQPELGRYVYFNDIHNSCLPSNQKSHTIVNWYLSKWKNKARNIDRICHGADIADNYMLGKVTISQLDTFPSLIGIQIVQYIGSLLFVSIYGLIRLPFEPCYGFLLEEILKCKRVELIDEKRLARDYLFHNSTPFYRPLWTYVAAKKGSRIVFYFYSTNSEFFKEKHKPSAYFPWHLISWSYYLVWDGYQVNFVSKFDKYKSVIEEVGPIWLSSSEKSIDIPQDSIAVFDVTPFRETWYVSLGLPSEYYTYRTTAKFLRDTQSILSQNDVHMVFKMKRTNVLANKRYLYQLNSLKKMKGFIDIDPDVDALRVIKKSKACISMPFTSTAIIAQYENKPSAYYDPLGIIQKNDVAGHNIPILSNVDELQEWIQRVVCE